MKRSSEDLSSLYTSTSSTGTAPTTACSHKSLKRLKLENEIFSKSIKDIEEMFAPVTEPTRVPHARISRRPSCDQYLPESNIPGNYNYDCINMAFLPHNRSTSATKVTSSNNNAVPILPSQRPRERLQPRSVIHRSPALYLDFDLADPEFEMSSTKESLEHDLKLIDQLVLLN